MTFLPIVERELRVAARRKSTFRIRWVTALLGIFIGGMTLTVAALNSLAGGASGVSVGLQLFYWSSWYLLGMCLLMGVFLAADCLSEERREGTLGFLFLTDLQGYDIVLGKLLAVSLNAFYGLLGVFPVLAMSLMLGGVTGWEFGRMSLALMNALWFSITVALWVSARCESSLQAMSQTMAWLVLLAVILPVFADVLRARTWAMNLASVSPFQPFYFAQAANFLHRAGDFWMSLAVSHLAGWLLVGLASWRLPRLMESQAAGEKAGFWRRLLTGDFLFGKKRRRPELLGINPVLWLVDDSRGLGWMNWVLAITGSVVVLMIGASEKEAMLEAPSLALPFLFLLKVLFALQTCRFFSEARRTGTLELLGTTPIDMKTLVAGQWRSLRGLFLLPVVVLMLAQILAVMVSFSRFGGWANDGLTFFWTFFLGLPGRTLNSVADFLAVGWFGMWMGLTMKKPQFASGLTILVVLILPYIVFCVPTFLIDVVFIVVYMAKLGRDFRVLRAEAEGNRDAVVIAPAP
jgi:ABC-type transport system involved in multi-copper enzyme maturation permease subunit